MLNKTKMMDEAKDSGKKRTSLSELLIFLTVFFVGNFLSNIILTPFISYYMLSDTKLFEIMNSKQPDMESFFTRMLELIEIAPEWLLILNITISFVFFIAAIIYCKFIEKRTVRSMGFRKEKLIPDYLLGIVLGVISVSVIILLCFVSGALNYKGIFDFSPMLLVIYFIACLAYGLGYETLFRGYYMISLSKYGGPMHALFMSSVIYSVINFTFVGGDFLALINQFMFAFLMGLFVIKKGNIWCATAFHGVWKFMQIIVFGAGINSTRVIECTANREYSALFGGIFGFGNGLIATLVLFLLIGIVWKLKQNPDEIAVNEETEG